MKSTQYLARAMVFKYFSMGIYFIGVILAIMQNYIMFLVLTFIAFVFMLLSTYFDIRFIVKELKWR